ncbi:MAG: hypothetical protein ACHQX4_08450 [Gemmatimonadales bacterium]
MRVTRRLTLAALVLILTLPRAAHSQRAARAVYLDSAGVVRWRDDRREVALFGANYVIHTASDYRAAGYVHGDRKRMIDEDMAQFARMGWDGLRLTFWGDWEASDSAGNLIQNDHLDLLDYLIARARERGIYMLLSPIQLYGSNWPDALGDTSQPGFGRHFGKERMGTDPAAIAAQVNYLRQILNHVNPYTGLALKDEPAILFIELVNEPWHHPEDLPGSIAYINALTDAVRATGTGKLVFYNVSQDFRIGEAIRQSRAQGVTFGWYPTGLNSGHELVGNYLRSADAYPDMLRPELSRLPRIVYEFDTPDLRTGYMYPAMARTFRAVGTQFAAMFAYDMLETASRNLGWQTHYLNLVYTPRKAMSAIIAAEAMRRLPRMQPFGPYPRNTRFGDFRVSYEENLSELLARDAFMYAGSTHSSPPDPAALTRIAGYGSSPLVTYGGEGTYFLDKVRPGLWRLEVYPDAVRVRDPFEQPDVNKIVTRAISRAWPMTIVLRDLGTSFTVQPITAGNARSAVAHAGRFTVTPGVYVLSARGAVDVRALPERVGALGFAEYHPPPTDSLPPLRLFDATDAPRLAFSRIGDAGRRGLFRVARSASGQPVFHFEMPAVGGGPAAGDYTTSLVILDRIRSRRDTMLSADTLRARLRGIGPRQVLHVTLMEDDGTSWSAAVPVDSTWSEQPLPLAAFTISRGVLLPEGFPGEWNYWVGPAAGRGTSGDHLRPDHIERLQLSLRKEDAVSAAPGSYGVEVEWVTLGFNVARTGR